jgi:hypothetical protein
MSVYHPASSGFSVSPLHRPESLLLDLPIASAFAAPFAHRERTLRVMFASFGLQKHAALTQELAARLFELATFCAH